MRSGIFILGVLLLAVGAALYFLPHTAVDVTNTAADGTRSSARATVATASTLSQIGLWTLIAGGIVALLGLIIPAPRQYVAVDHDPDGHVVRTEQVTTRRTKSGRVVSRSRKVKEYE
jgi:hypothetical protein